MLKEGQAAPAFAVRDTENNEVTLESLRGSYSLVCFFRYAGCLFCSLSLVRLIERYENFSQRGLKIVSFFQSADESISKYIAIHNPPFALVGDPEKVVYDAYHVQHSVAGTLRSLAEVPEAIRSASKAGVKQGEVEGDIFLMPAQFIIGPDLKLLKVHYGNTLRDTISMLDIEEVLLQDVGTAH